MLRTAAKKVAWVGRTASMVFGLALVMALLFGVATMAVGATGGNFLLGKANSAGATTRLTSAVAGPALNLVNNGTAAAATALNITVPSGNPPMTVNSSTKVTNLNSDQLDGKEAADFAPTAHTHDDRYFTEAESDGRYLGPTLLVRTTRVTTPANTNGNATARCQPGEQATGGGVQLESGNNTNIHYFEPGGVPVSSNGQPNGWFSSWFADTQQAQVKVSVVCAS